MLLALSTEKEQRPGEVYRGPEMEGPVLGPCAQKGPLCPSLRQGIRRAGTGSSCRAQCTLPAHTGNHRALPRSPRH